MQIFVLNFLILIKSFVGCYPSNQNPGGVTVGPHQNFYPRYAYGCNLEGEDCGDY